MSAITVAHGDATAPLRELIARAMVARPDLHHGWNGSARNPRARSTYDGRFVQNGFVTTRIATNVNAATMYAAPCRKIAGDSAW